MEQWSSLVVVDNITNICNITHTFNITRNAYYEYS